MDFTQLIRPRSIAIVGASAVKAKGRYDYTDWISSAGFTGKLYPVNPRYKEVQGLRCYPSLKDIPDDIDMVIILIPAQSAIDILKDTPRGKVKFAIVITSGFSEIGEKELERDLVEAAHSRGIRIIGPNCLGVYSRQGRIATTIGLPYGPDPGEIAILSQSGGNTASIIRATVNSGVTANCGISIGNQCDICIEDLLEWFDTQDDIKLVAGYVEDFKQSRKFIDLAKKISLRKPIVIWKGGKTPQGSHAASSHTGAMAIPGDLWKGIIRQTGIIPAYSALDIINISRALLLESLPQGPGVCIIHPGGGGSVSMTDHCIQAGLEVPLFSPPVRSELSNIISKLNTIISNPIDLGAASYTPQIIKDTIITAVKDKNIHSIIYNHYIYPFKGTGSREMGMERLTALSEVRQVINKPIYIAIDSPYYNLEIMDEAKREAFEYMNKLKIPYIMNMERCANMVRRVVDYSRYVRGRGSL